MMDRTANPRIFLLKHFLIVFLIVKGFQLSLFLKECTIVIPRENIPTPHNSDLITVNQINRHKLENWLDIIEKRERAKLY